METLPELDELWTRQEGFMIVRHPFVRLVSAYEVRDLFSIFIKERIVKYLLIKLLNFLTQLPEKHSKQKQKKTIGNMI